MKKRKLKKYQVGTDGSLDPIFNNNIWGNGFAANSSDLTPIGLKPMRGSLNQFGRTNYAQDNYLNKNTPPSGNTNNQSGGDIQELSPGLCVNAMGQRVECTTGKLIDSLATNPLNEGFTMDSDGVYRKKEITESGTLGYSDGFKGFNQVLDLTQAIAGNINDVKTNQRERRKYIEAIQPDARYNPYEKGLNNVPVYMAKGGMVKRKDSSYSKRGLWDNIRANKGSGKKPTKAMLEQEHKIKAKMQAGGQPTSMDSANIYNAQLALNRFYESELKKGRIVKNRTSKYTPTLTAQKLKDENIKFYRDQIRERADNLFGETFEDDAYEALFNLKSKELKQLTNKGLGQSKGGNQYQVYYRDIITPRQNLAAPFALYDERISPQNIISYNPSDRSYPGGNVTVYEYDTAAIKPYNMRTPEEKVAWDKKYGKPGTVKARTPDKKTLSMSTVKKPTPPPERFLAPRNRSNQAVIGNTMEGMQLAQGPNISVEQRPIENLPYQVDWKMGNEARTNYFPSEAEGAEFLKELDPFTGLPEYRNRGDYKTSGRYTLADKLRAFQSGGKPPIFTENPNDPRVKRYNDSLSLYKKGEIEKARIRKAAGAVTELMFTELSPDDIADMMEGFYTKPAYDDFKRTGIMPDREYIDSTKEAGYSRAYFGYKKPVQPYIYKKPDPTLKPRNRVNQELIETTPGIPQLAQGPNLQIEQRSIQNLPYQVDWKMGNEARTNYFASEAEGAEFLKELNPITGLPEYRNRGNYEASGRYTQADKLRGLQKGGFVNNTGYLPGTESENNPYNIIPSNNITMQGVPRNIMAYPNNGDPVLMLANSGEYNFPDSDYVLEVPEMKTGGIPDRYKNKGFTKVGAKRKSTRPGKKWMVLAKKGDKYKIVHGGDSSMKDFSQHKDKKRQKNFWNRMGTSNDPFSARYWHKKFGTWQDGGFVDDMPNAELEQGEVFQTQQGGITKVPESEPRHEDGGSPQANVSRVLEDTSDKRKDKDSKMLSIKPDDAFILTGFKPKKSVSHSKLYEQASESYNKKVRGMEKKLEANMNFIKYKNGGVLAKNALDENIKMLETMPKPIDIFDAIYNHQEEVKQRYNITNETNQAKTGGRKLPMYQNGTINNIQPWAGDKYQNKNNASKYTQQQWADKLRAKGYTGALNNLDVQKFLYTTPKGKEIIDGLHTQYPGTIYGDPAQQRFDEKLGYRWDSALDSLPDVAPDPAPVLPPEAVVPTPTDTPTETLRKYNFSKRTEPSKFNEPLRWYDTMPHTLNYLSSLGRTPVDLEQLQYEPVNAREESWLPQIMQTEGDFQTALRSLPMNGGVGQANIANILGQKYAADQQAIAGVESRNKAKNDQMNLINAQGRMQVESTNLNLRDTFNNRILQGKEAQRISKLNAFNDYATMVAQNAKLNREGNLLMQLTPYFDQFAQFNGNKYTPAQFNKDVAGGRYTIESVPLNNGQVQEWVIDNQTGRRVRRNEVLQTPERPIK